MVPSPVISPAATAAASVSQPLSTLILAGIGVALFFLGWAFGAKRERIRNLTSTDIDI